MTELLRAIPRATALALVVLAGAATKGGSQEAPLDRDELARYARAYLAIDAAREEFHAKIARIHDDVGLLRAREELDARVEQILVEHQISSERYGIITLLISQNEEARAVFEEISRQLREGGGVPPAEPR